MLPGLCAFVLAEKKRKIETIWEFFSELAKLLRHDQGGRVMGRARVLEKFPSSLLAIILCQIY
jgi:hypothetical protein